MRHLNDFLIKKSMEIDKETIYLKIQKDRADIESKISGQIN